MALFAIVQKYETFANCTGLIFFCISRAVVSFKKLKSAFPDVMLRLVFIPVKFYPLIKPYILTVLP